MALRPVFNAVWFQDPEAYPFHKPVDPYALGIPVSVCPLNVICPFMQYVCPYIYL